MNCTASPKAAKASPPHNIGRAALLLTGFMVVQKALVLVQQVFIGRVAGFNAETDAFYIAQLAPLMIGAWIMVSLTTTIIPMLRSGDLGHFTGVALNVILVLTLFSAGLVVLAGPIISVLGHGLTPDATTTAIRLLREMAIILLLMGATGVLNSLYYYRSRFLVPSIASCLLYVGGIGGVFLEQRMGIDSLAWGMLVGAIAQVLMLCWFLDSQDWRRPVFAWRQIASFGKSLVTILIATSVGILWLIVDRAFSSSGRGGTVAAVTIASGLMTVPSAMVVSTLNSALLPALVLLRDNRAAFSAMLRHALVYTSFFVVPASLILFFGSTSLIGLLFRSAKLDAYSLMTTSGLLSAYSFGILGLALKDIFSTALIALDQEWLPMLAGLLTLSTSVALKMLYPPASNPLWIATSTSVAMWTGAVLLVAWMSKQRAIWRQFWAEDGWRLAIANGVFAAFYLSVQSYLPLSSTVSSFALLGASALSYLAAAKFLHFRITDLRTHAYAHNDGQRPS